MRLTWRDTNAIRDHGYCIQDITNKEAQAAITLIQNPDQ